MLAIEILENIKEGDVIISKNRIYPCEEFTYAINRVVSTRYNERNCNSITQDLVQVARGGAVEYSKIVKVCDPNSNIYLLFSYLENLEFELKRAKELKNEYSDKTLISISPRDDSNNRILDEALGDYITSHDELINSVKHKIVRELNLLKKQ
jgi:hypothetical protein